MARTGTKLSSHQIKESGVTGENIASRTVQGSDIALDAVGTEHIQAEAVEQRHLSSETAARLLPADTDRRRYYEAIAATSYDPSGQNPFLTRHDLGDSIVFWAAPYEGLDASFSGDPNFAVRLDTVDISLHAKNAQGVVVPVSMDHSVALNLETRDDARHVTTRQKQLVERLVNVGFDPSDPESPGVRMTQPQHPMDSRHTICASLANNDSFVFSHPDIVDEEFERSVTLYMPTTIAGVWYMGHGFYPRVERTRLYNFSTRSEVDNASRYVADTTIDVDLRDDISPYDGAYWMTQGLAGLRLARTSNALESAEIISGRKARLTFDSAPSDTSLPLILSNIETGGGNGFASIIDQSLFSPSVDLGTYSTRICQVASDGQGTAYVLGLDSAGALWCKRCHPSGMIAPVTIIPATTVARWTNMRFDKIAASITIINTTLGVTRMLFVFLANASGDRVLLASEDLPNTFGDDAREAETAQLVMYSMVIDAAEWEGFIPNTVQAISVGQGILSGGLPLARGVVLAADANTIRWISLPHAASDLTSACQYGTFPDAEGRGASFHACGGKNTIELIARSADGQGQWYKRQMEVTAAGSLAEITEGARGATIVTLPDYGFVMADICYVDASVASDEGDSVVFGALNPESGEAVIVWHRLSAGGIAIMDERKAIRQLRVGSSLRMVGGIDATLLVADVFPESVSFSTVAVADADTDYLAADRQFEGEALAVWHCPARYGVSPFDTTMDFVSRATRQAGDELVVNSHDACLVVAIDGSLSLSRRATPVKMRGQGVYPPAELMPVPVSDLVQAEGAAMSSIAHVASSNEWLFISGGLPASTGFTAASNQLVAFRRNGAYWQHVSGLMSNTFKARCYHGQYVIGCRDGYAPGGIPAASSLVFVYGGRTRGKIEDPTVGNMVTAELCRVLMTDLDLATPTDPSDAMASGILYSGNLQRTIPSMVNPVIFMSYDGTDWHMFFVDAPNVYKLSESSGAGRSFFGTTLPSEADAVRLNPETAVTLSSRGASAIIQYDSDGPTLDESAVAWNPDRNVASFVPRTTKMLLFGSEAVEGYASLKILTLMPYDGYTPHWNDVMMSGNEIPPYRVDATLVYSGIHCSTLELTHHFFYMFGGRDTSGSVMDDLWLLDYYVDDEGAHRGFWSKLGSASEHGLMRGASSVSAARVPNITSKTLTSSRHDVYFYGGRGSGGAALSDMVRIQLPVQMKFSADLNVPAMVIDSGGHSVPYTSWIMSDPISIAQLGQIGGDSLPPVLVAYDDNASSPSYPTQGIIRMGLGFDDPSRVYYVDAAGDWYGPVQWGEFDQLPSIADFATGLAITPLPRGGESFFTNERYLYIVLGIVLPDPSRRLLVHSVTLPATIDPLDGAEDAVLWQEYRRVTGISVTMPTPRSTMVTNTTGGALTNLRIVVAGRRA